MKELGMAISTLALFTFFVGVWTIWCRACEAYSVPAVLVFGDSYGDPGNNNHIATLIRSDFPPYGRDFVGQKPTGRFSDGKIMPDYFVERLGSKELLPAYLDPGVAHEDLVTGVSFASSGSGLDNLTTTTLSVIPFWKQIEHFEEYRNRLSVLMGQKNVTTMLNKAIVFITVGTNDFIANYFLQPIRRLQYNVYQYQDFLLQTYSSYIQELYSLDVRRIGLINLPPLGCLPFEKTLRFLQSRYVCVEEINDAASGFNSKLVAMIEALKTKLPPGLKIVSLDYYSLVLDAIKSPHQYGFEETGRACCGSGSIEFGILCNSLSPLTCIDASKYVFFDSIHLTQKSYSIISESFLSNGINELL